MRYVSGEIAKPGDVIALDQGHRPTGRIVVLIESREAVLGFKAEEWAYLKFGFMAEFDGMGLMHFDSFDEDVIFVSRATGNSNRATEK
ncbi:MAG: hypothetical protein JNM76_03695 [Betaproteobacteria bacterium]|nr:hypothetical protein [Betaproteobacteria bacterium]